MNPVDPTATTYVRRTDPTVDDPDPCTIPGCIECKTVAHLFVGFAAAMEAWQSLIRSREQAIAVMIGAYDELEDGRRKDDARVDLLRKRLHTFRQFALLSEFGDAGFVDLGIGVKSAVKHALHDNAAACIRPELVAYDSLVRRATIANIALHGIQPADAEQMYDEIAARAAAEGVRVPPYVSYDGVVTPDSAQRDGAHWGDAETDSDDRPIPFPTWRVN